MGRVTKSGLHSHCVILTEAWVGAQWGVCLGGLLLYFLSPALDSVFLLRLHQSPRSLSRAMFHSCHHCGIEMSSTIKV